MNDQREADRIRKREKRKANRLMDEDRRAMLEKFGLVTVDMAAQALRVNRGRLKELSLFGLHPLTFGGEQVFAIADILPALRAFQASTTERKATS